MYAYASLYKASAINEDEIKTSDMTITFISSHYPYKLEKYLAQHRHYCFVKSGEGIYQIVGNDFTVQIIVTSQISRKENLWIWGINNSVDNATAAKLVSEYKKNKNNQHYEAVIDIIIRANERIFKGDQKMCKALEELMEERIVEREQKAKIEARAEDILFFLEECGEIPKKLQELILGEMDMAVLERWLKIAGKVKSIEEFRNAI